MPHSISADLTEEGLGERSDTVVSSTEFESHMASVRMFLTKYKDWVLTKGVCSEAQNAPDRKIKVTTATTTAGSSTSFKARYYLLPLHTAQFELQKEEGEGFFMLHIFSVTIQNV